MTDGPSAPAAPDWTTDWVEICQSEWRAMANDREPAETAAACAALWSEGLAAALALAALFADGAARRAWPRQPAGSPSALAPSDTVNAARGDAGGDAAGGERLIAELAARVAELERRLAGLDPASGAPPGP